MRKGRPFMALSVFVFSLLLAAPPPGYLTAQQGASQKQPDLQYEVVVTLKLVQVYVTDKDGQPVLDLTRDDFIVLDNGQPVALTAFEKYALAAAPAAPEAARAVQAPGETRILNRRFVLLFDFAFNNQKGVVAAVEAARHFLEAEVRPEDEVALLSYSMLKGLKVHEYFTQDHQKVREAVAKIKGKEISGRADEVEQAYWQLAQMAELQPISDALQRQINTVEGQRRDSQHQVRGYLEDLTALAKALRLVQGKKEILLFSTGIPYSLIYVGRIAGQGKSSDNQSGHGTVLGSQFQVGESTLSPLQETMLREFSAAGCSFYSFDTRESSKLASLYSYDETLRATGLGGAFGADGVGKATTSPLRDDSTTGQDSLRRLSKETSGQYFSNISLYAKNLDQVQTITGAYYVLGYSLPTAWDGKFHEIKVDVKREGCRVRAQSGYFNPKPFRDYSGLEKDLQLFDLALNGRSDLAAPKPLPMAALAYDAGEGERLRAVARIPKEALAGFGGKKAEFVALIFDEKDNLASLQRATVALADYRGKDVLFSSGIAPRPGLYKCRLVIRDLDSGQSAVASASANIVKRAAARFAVASPLLVAAADGLSSVEGVTKGKQDFLSWREVYPFEGARLAPLLGEIAPSGRIGAIVPVMIKASDDSGVKLSGNLVNAETGASLPVPLEIKSKSRQADLVIHLVEFALAGVPDGKYLFFVHAADKLSGALSQTHVPLTIRR